MLGVGSAGLASQSIQTSGSRETCSGMVAVWQATGGEDDAEVWFGGALVGAYPCHSTARARSLYAGRVSRRAPFRDARTPNSAKHHPRPGNITHSPPRLYA